MRAQLRSQPATKRAVLHRKLLPLDDDFGRLLELQTAWLALKEPLLYSSRWPRSAYDSFGVCARATAVEI